MHVPLVFFNGHQSGPSVKGENQSAIVSVERQSRAGRESRKESRNLQMSRRKFQSRSRATEQPVGPGPVSLQLVENVRRATRTSRWRAIGFISVPI